MKYTVNVWATVRYELEVEAESADAAKEVALSSDLSPHEVEHCLALLDVDVDVEWQERVTLRSMQ